ncbi:ABC transporter ATP-binding protein [Oscillospiraceae bacterium MB08-C2-2]|nr:ABC transporter ATP-binding protein [Oscillospiraceae bacterium MB08-C2-2]
MLLEINNLAKSFGGVQAVKNVSLKVDSDQIISVIGPNGAGKTTVFNLISGIYKADAGQILFEGQELIGKPQHEIALAGIARTFQNIRLFPGLSVTENIMISLDPISHYNVLSAMMTLPDKRRMEKENRARIREILKVVQLEEYADENPKNLSYGIQRRVELARAIANNPKLLMLDEPAAGLNPREVLEFIAMIRVLKEQYHFGILIIEHRMQVVNDLSDHVYVVNFGNLLTHGTPSEVQNNPEVIKAYIGEEKNNAGD